VSKDANEVSHRPADNQQSRLLSHPLSGHSLKTVHRRVLAEHVIAKLSTGNGLSHRRRRQGNGVTAQVNYPHQQSPFQKAILVEDRLILTLHDNQNRIARQQQSTG
jgi:hypothetical protein